MSAAGKRKRRRPNASTSSIDRLPPDIRSRLDAWIQDRGVTQTEAVRLCNQALAELYPDHPPVSKSAVNRYDLSTRKAGERMLRGRHISEFWAKRFGSVPAGRMGHMVNEMLQTLSFEALEVAMEGKVTAESLPDTVALLKDMALAGKRLASAAADSERRERLIREDERKLAAEEAAEAAGQAARSQGLSGETADAIRRKILGVGA